MVGGGWRSLAVRLVRVWISRKRREKKKDQGIFTIFVCVTEWGYGRSGWGEG